MLPAAVSCADHPPDDDKPVQTRPPTSRRGNIHTGATPPWLQDDDDDSDDVIGGDGQVESKGRRGSGSQIPVLIGPSDAEFQKHSTLFPLVTLL